MKHLSILLLAALLLPAVAGATDWPDAFRGAATGGVRWPGQVPTLAAVADVKQTQILEDSLAATLTANTIGALGVLDILGAGHRPCTIGSDIVCTPLTETPDEMDALYQWMHQVLLSTVVGAKCLWTLEASHDELRTDNAHKVKQDSRSDHWSSHDRFSFRLLLVFRQAKSPSLYNLYAVQHCATMYLEAFSTKTVERACDMNDSAPACCCPA